MPARTSRPVESLPPPPRQRSVWSSFQPIPRVWRCLFDGEAFAWLSEPRVSPYGGRTVRWDSTQRATSGALVVGDRFGDDGRWQRYLALNRHAGLEACYSDLLDAYRENRVFSLRQIVGLTWHVLAVQKDACE